MRRVSTKGIAGGAGRFASYLRCSTDEQADKEYSTIDAQRAIIEGYIAGKGGTLVNEYADEGRTGTTLNRPGWKSLLADAQAGKFDAVVVTYMSRLGRGKSYYNAEYELDKFGVKVVTVKEDFGKGTAGYMNQAVKNFMDGMYPAQVSEWTRAKMEAMQENGYYCGGPLPFGYTSVPIEGVAAGAKSPPRRLIPSPDAPIVRAAFQRFLETGFVAEVVTYLREATGIYWDKTKAKRFLTNAFYRGATDRAGKVKEGTHEAIVTPEEWEAVQERLAEVLPLRHRRRRSDATDPTPYYLRGVVYCGVCGCKMTPANSHGAKAAVRYYTCVNASKRGAGVCPIGRVNAHTLHDAVLTEIHRAANAPTRLTQIIRDAVKLVPASDKLAAQEIAVTRRLREKERQIDQITGAVASAGASRALKPLLDKLDALEGERETLAQEAARIGKELATAKVRRPQVSDLQDAFGRFLELWEAATEPEREELLPLLVDRVEMEGKEKANARLLFSLPPTRGERCSKRANGCAPLRPPENTYRPPNGLFRLRRSPRPTRAEVRARRIASSAGGPHVKP